MRFIEVRHLGLEVYKDKKGNPVVPWKTGLTQDRDETRRAILRHEIVTGAVVLDPERNIESFGSPPRPEIVEDEDADDPVAPGDINDAWNPWDADTNEEPEPPDAHDPAPAPVKPSELPSFMPPRLPPSVVTALWTPPAATLSLPPSGTLAPAFVVPSASAAVLVGTDPERLGATAEPLPNSVKPLVRLPIPLPSKNPMFTYEPGATDTVAGITCNGPKLASQRKAELDEMGSVKVRALATLKYLKKNRQPLVQYADAIMTDGEEMKRLVLAYEIQKGLVNDDLGGGVADAYGLRVLAP